MKACFHQNSQSVAPFGDLPDQLPILGKPLRVVQEEAIRACGLEPVSEPPLDEPYLRVGSRCWFTARLLRRFLDTALPEGPNSDAARHGGRLRLVHPGYQEVTEALQDLPGPGLHDLAILPPSAPRDLETLPPIDVRPLLQLQPLPDRSNLLHSERAFALPLGEEYVHQIDHWSHLWRVNLLAFLAWGGSQKRTLFDERGLFIKALVLVALLLKARSLNPARIAAALTVKGRRCRIHPTAVVEACRLGDDVVVDAYAVVRGSWLGDGVHVEDHATVSASILGDRSRVNRHAIANLMLLFDGAVLSVGGGFQASVLGRDAFVAMHATILDLSFHGNVRVLHRGQRVDAGLPFLGAAIGHRSRIGSGVTLGFGSEVPNDASVVLDVSRVYRRWPEGAGELLKM